jgi:ABC-type oligopeptide transport system substrate-binding subunit
VTLLRKTQLRQTPLRSNPYNLVVLTVNGEEYEYETDDYVYVGYRRPEIVKDNIDDDSDLSDEIKWKLFLARQLALLKYKEKWG